MNTLCSNQPISTLEQSSGVGSNQFGCLCCLCFTARSQKASVYLPSLLAIHFYSRCELSITNHESKKSGSPVFFLVKPPCLRAGKSDLPIDLRCSHIPIASFPRSISVVEGISGSRRPKPDQVFWLSPMVR